MTDHVAILNRLERENRRLKLAVVVVLAVVAGTALMAQLPPPERVEAQEFVLVSETGEVRAMLNLGQYPMLSFYDDNEELTMILGMSTDGPVLGAIQPDGTPLNYLSPDPHVVPLR